MAPQADLLKYMFKMGLAGALITLVAIWLSYDLIQWMWMAISGFMVMDANLGVSIKAGLARSLGTISGTIFGSILGIIWAAGDNYHGVLALFLIGFIGAFFAHRYQSLKLFCMSAAVIFILSANITQPAWQIMVDRIIENVIAIIICILVSVYIFPERANQKFTQKIRQCYQMINQCLADIHADYLEGHSSTHHSVTLGKITVLLNQCASHCQHQQYEDWIAFGNTGKNMAQLVLHAELLKRYTEHLLDILKPPTTNNLANCFTDQLQKILNEMHLLFETITHYDPSRHQAQHWINPAPLKCATEALRQQLINFRKGARVATFETDDVITFYAYLNQLKLIALEFERL